MGRTRNKRILSMDLSLNLPAFAVTEVVGDKLVIKEISHIDNKKGKKITTAEKLDKTYQEVKRLLKKYKKFDVVVRERGFSRYANTTQLLFRVVGVTDLVALQVAGIDKIEEIPPATIKVAVAGFSRAEKKEVEKGVRAYLTEEQKDIEFYSDDESDAVAVAITYCIKNGWFVKNE